MLLADDNLIVREGLRALLEATGEFEVIGIARDYDELITRARELEPHVIVSDIRMPPTFQKEGVQACREVRARRPATGIVILSQYDEPEYAVALLAEGASGCAYLLKDRVSEGDQLARAIREVCAGGSVLDPKIVDSLVRPVDDGRLSARDRELLQLVAEGRSIKDVALTLGTTSADVVDSVDALFLKLAQDASAGRQHALRSMRLLHQAIVLRDQQRDALSRLVPTGIAGRMRHVGESERAEVTVLMSDVRGYSRLAEVADPMQLCEQLNAHRGAAVDEILSAKGTVMQFVGDAVMAVFGAPDPLIDHADRALSAALAIQRRQAALNREWEASSLAPFALGIGLSTGVVAAALLGSEERMEYSVVGDAVNLTQRLQQLAEGGQIVLSEATFQVLTSRPAVERMGPLQVDGRQRPVIAYRMAAPSDR